MTTKKTYRKELALSIQGEWVTALERKKTLNLQDSAKSIGRTMRSIVLANPAEFEEKKVQGLWHYRRRLHPITPQMETPEIVTTPPPTPLVTPVPGKVPVSKATTNITSDLKNIIHELKGQGEDVQNICYTALTERKKKIDDEYRYVLTNAPSVANQINRFKSTIHNMENQLADLMDFKAQLEGKKMLKRFKEERDVQRGIS